MIIRKQIVNHLIAMEKTQPAYAQYALAYYDRTLPWMDIRGAYNYQKSKVSK